MFRLPASSAEIGWSTAILAAFAAMLVEGCSNAPVFPQFRPDAAIECGQEGLSCAATEVCLEGHCYAMCSATGCGPRESCVGGICVPFAGDAGTDAGRDTPPDPCEDVVCEAPTPVCSRGTCVACDLDESSCGGLAPICRVSRNECVSFIDGSFCEPCNTTADCTGGLTCTVIGVAAAERVCLAACGSCPTGAACDTALDACRPSLNATCFQWRASGATCAADADCTANGATIDEGLFPGSCAGTCRLPCGTATDCPSGACDGASGFCM